ncbi:MAG: hypothetical protein HY293_14485 [Planctomycetes bacterium]|nr:hypothetical protein [Planctomycetota bacterium]
MGRSFRFLLLAALAGCTTNNDSISFGGFPRAVAVDATHAYVAGDLISFFFLKKGAQTDQWRIEKRQLSDGAPDPAFGSGGAVIVRISAAPRAIVLDATSLYVGGGGSSGWRLEKRDLATGSLVAGFGAG